MNFRGIIAIYIFEMTRTMRTVGQSIASPVISTVLYFVVFGSAIGSHIQAIGGVSYGSFIVPGLIMLTVLGQSVSNASFGIYFPRFTGTIYEILSAPLSFIEIVIGWPNFNELVKSENHSLSLMYSTLQSFTYYYSDTAKIYQTQLNTSIINSYELVEWFNKIYS